MQRAGDTVQREGDGLMTIWIGRIEPSMWFEGQWWQDILPPDVRLAVLSLGVRRLREEDLLRAHEQILEKVEQLDAEGVDVINVGGSPVVTVFGKPGHERLIKEIGERTSRPFVTALTAEMEAIRAVSSGQKILIASPYPVAQTEKRVTVLAEEGMTVLAHDSLDIERNRVIAVLDPQEVARQAIDLAKANPDGDVIYMPCGSFPAPQVIDQIEDATGLPVVTCVQAQVHASLIRAGYDRPIEGYGKLLREIGRQPVLV
jgi:maleate cis-trans isomerase